MIIRHGRKYFRFLHSVQCAALIGTLRSVFLLRLTALHSVRIVDAGVEAKFVLLSAALPEQSER